MAERLQNKLGRCNVVESCVSLKESVRWGNHLGAGMQRHSLLHTRWQAMAEGTSSRDTMAVRISGGRSSSRILGDGTRYEWDGVN